MKKIVNILFLLSIATAANAQYWSKALEKSAKKGNIEAQIKVADAYLNGLGVEKDLNKAAKWYYEAVQQGSEEAKPGFYSFYSKQLEKYAKSGDAQAQYEVGCDYMLGTGVDKDIKEAAEWLLKAMDQNHKQAEDVFHTFYSKELEKRAKAGNARAQYELGNCYLMAREISRDTEEAAEWYLEAMAQDHKEATEKFYSFYSKKLEKRAKEGDDRAQFEVGNCYFKGNNVEKDTETASEWYLKAMGQGHEGAKEQFYSFYSKELEKRAKHGDVRAQYEVGNGYFDGFVIKKDLDTAAEWYLKAMGQGHEEAKAKFYSFYSKELVKLAKRGDAEAQFQVGNCYYNGNGTDKDIKEASEWYLKSMSQGHEGAKTMFYSYYSKELEKRAKEGDVEAQFQVGNCYFEGNQVETDRETAAEWYLKALEKGHEKATEKFYSFFSKQLVKRAKDNDPQAQFELGNYCFSGKGIDKDTEEAAEWYLKAMIQGHEEAKTKFYSFYSKQLEKRAKNGDALAQYEVGNGYLEGLRVKKDTETAAEWFLKAMSQGHEEAKAKFYSFYSKELEKRAKNGDAQAQYEVGNGYFKGNIVKKDNNTAAEWYLKAMSQGHEEAKTKFYSFYSKELEKRAKSGDAQAQYEIGNHFFSGTGVKIDKETAAEWYLEAKMQGHEEAAEKFYSFYSKTLEKASKKDVEALYRLGSFYVDGQHVEKNIKKGNKMLLEAYEKGHDDAFNKFSSVYSKDLEKMAKKGNIRARIAVAKCYINGNGIEKNTKKAVSLLEDLTENAEFGKEVKILLENL